MARTMTALEHAVAAADEALRAEAERKRREQEAAEQAKRERIQVKLDAAKARLDEWFPGIEWDIVDDGEQSYYSALVLREKGGDSRLLLRIDRLMLDVKDPEAGYKTTISVVNGVNRDMYHHWDALPGGKDVKDLVDIGCALKRVERPR